MDVPCFGHREGETMSIDIKDLTGIKVACVNPGDRPDFSDAFFSFALKNSRTLTHEELDQLALDYPDVLNTMAHESLE